MKERNWLRLGGIGLLVFGAGIVVYGLAMHL
jgi:hypothetical protein